VENTTTTTTTATTTTAAPLVVRLRDVIDEETDNAESALNANNLAELEQAKAVVDELVANLTADCNLGNISRCDANQTAVLTKLTVGSWLGRTRSPRPVCGLVRSPRAVLEF